MGTITLIVSWFVANWDLLLGVILGILAVAGLFAKLTPSKKDDEVIGRLADFFSRFQKSKPTDAAPSTPEVKKDPDVLFEKRDL